MEESEPRPENMGGSGEGKPLPLQLKETMILLVLVLTLFSPSPKRDGDVRLITVGNVRQAATTAVDYNANSIPGERWEAKLYAVDFREKSIEPQRIPDVRFE